MLSRIISCALMGVDGYQVDVEVDISSGLPSFDLVGLPDSAVKEAKERVRTAIKNSGLLFPVKRITVNLAPADIKKEGPSFDLPIAVGILVCMGLIPQSAVDQVLITGELSLDGTVRPVSGILPMVYAGCQKGVRKCIVPFENREEAAIVQEAQVYPVKSLSELIAHLTNKTEIARCHVDSTSLFQEQDGTLLDFADVKGQETVKRAMEIGAAGMHNILMIGPPGSGKTMLAKRLPSILPDLTFEESIEITKIHSVAGLLKDKGTLIRKRPFRAPHHTISASALTGGGRIPRPGEISLAHNGVLFLDELPEFQRNVLEIMRQPLEDRRVTISRVHQTLTYPANFMLVAAMNPCPCGYLGDQRCHCTTNSIAKYMGKISGPLLDRIDIFAETPAVHYEDLENNRPQESSAEIRKRVETAQKIQLERYAKDHVFFNSQLTPPQIEKYCYLGREEKLLIKAAFDRLQLSARAYHKILKIARTVADLDQSDRVSCEHIAEVLQYRSLDPKYTSY